jgi:hypothetical protein
MVAQGDAVTWAAFNGFGTVGAALPPAALGGGAGRPAPAGGLDVRTPLVPGCDTPVVGAVDVPSVVATVPLPTIGVPGAGAAPREDEEQPTATVRTTIVPTTATVELIRRETIPPPFVAVPSTPW